MSEQRLDDEDAGLLVGATIAPSEPLPAAEPGPVNGEDLSFEEAIAEFDRAAPQSAAKPQPTPVDPLQEQQFNEDLAAQDRERADAGERAFQQAYQRELSLQQERLAFSEECDRIQSLLPDHVPAGYARAALLAASIEDPRLESAWQARNINPAELRAELQRVTAQFIQLRSNPTADPRQIEQLRQWGAQLEVAVDARSILRQAELRLINEAKKVKKPVDPDVTSDRLMVAQAVRGQSISSIPEEPAPDLSTSDRQRVQTIQTSIRFRVICLLRALSCPATVEQERGQVQDRPLSLAAANMRTGCHGH